MNVFDALRVTQLLDSHPNDLVLGVDRDVLRTLLDTWVAARAVSRDPEDPVRLAFLCKLVGA